LPVVVSSSICGRQHAAGSAHPGGSEVFAQLTLVAVPRHSPTREGQGAGPRLRRGI